MLQKYKHVCVPLLLLILGLLLRFIWLDRIPSAIGGDELVYVLEAKSIAVSGSDLSGTWNPWTVFLFKYPPEELQAELPYFLNLPVAGAFPFSLLSARITSAVLSVLTLVGMYFLAHELFAKRVALATLFVAAINPWWIYMGRTVYEVVPAVCFYVWAMYISLHAKGRYFLWSIPIYILAFYSYIGTKVIFLPIILITAYMVLRENPKGENKKKILWGVVIAVLFMSFFILSLLVSDGPSRVSNIISLSDPAITQAVDSMRKTSIRSPLVDIYVNKYTVMSAIVITKLLRSLSFDYLFVYGDKFFSLYNHGLFYYIDAFFLLAGLVAMYTRHRRKMLYMSLFAFVGIVPHIVHSASTEDFSHHLGMMIPFLIIFIGYGISEIVSSVFPKRKHLVFGAIIIVYGILAGNFLQNYWFQHSLSGQFDFSVRVMSKYLQLQIPDRKILVYTSRTSDIYKKYLFYSNGVDSKTLPVIAKALTSNNIRMDNIAFVGCDAKSTIPADTTVVYDSECGALPVDDNFLKITRLKDGGQEFRVYNDVICSKYQLKPYPSNFMLSDLNIEPMEGRPFCETYIAR